MNAQLVDSLVKVIQSLQPEERLALEEKLFFVSDYPSSVDLASLAGKGSSFDFLVDEPDLYSLSDGEPIDAVG